MNTRSLFRTFFLLIIFYQIHLGFSQKVIGTPSSVEEAEKIIAKNAAKKAKKAKKDQKKAEKIYWDRQSKQAKKSVKNNAKRQKRYHKQKK